MIDQYLRLASNAAILFAMAVGVFCVGNICAHRVWERTKQNLTMDTNPDEVIVPYSSSIEAILILFAVMLRSPYRLVLAAFRETRLMDWEKTPGMRAVDHYSSSRLDLLGSVADMVSGYPERAQAFFHQQLSDIRVKEFRAYWEDELALRDPRQGNQAIS